MEKKRPKRGAAAAAILLTLAGCAWYGNRTIEKETLTVRSAALPAAFDGFRVAQITDLHGAEFGENNEYLLALVRGAEPDIIALCGDVLHDDSRVEEFRPFLQALSAIAPTFFVTGNHEWGMAKADRAAFFKMLGDCGITRLENEYRVLKKGGEQIVLAGVDDPNGPAGQKTPAALVREIRAEMGENCYILMLSHRNDEIETWKALGVQTVLCGHAHGGIVRLPGLGPVFGTHYELFPEYSAGLYVEGGTAMSVSRGLGASRRLPIRIGNRPHLPVVVLKQG